MVKATKKKSSSSTGGGKKKRSSMQPTPSSLPAAADAAAAANAPDTPSVGMRTSSIANKLVRKDKYAKLKHKQKVDKANLRRARQAAIAAAEAAGDDSGPKRQVPRTIESTRERDATALDDASDPDYVLSSATDEFAPYFSRRAVPRVLVTTSHKPKASTFGFVADLLEVIPNSTFYKRVGGARLRPIMRSAKKRGFTHAVVLHESKRDKGLPDSMLVVHLGPASDSAASSAPGSKSDDDGADGDDRRGGDGRDEGSDDAASSPSSSDPEEQGAGDPFSSTSLGAGPTARFRVTNVRRCRDIRGHGRPTEHSPELVLRGFGTSAGSRVGRLLASMFPVDPAFRGRQVATLHAQRDFIFFRHHRYVFEEKEDPRAKRLATEAKKKEKRRRRSNNGGGGVGASAAAVDAAASSSPSAREQQPPPTKVVARLQELGPRFTLKLLDLRKGVLCGNDSEREWAPSREARKARRKFAL